MLCGVITALVTPMYQDGRIDFDSLTNLVLFQNKHGVDGLAIAGSTGEGSLLSEEEKIAIVSHVIKINKGCAKIIVVFNEIATNFAVEFTKKLNAIAGIDYYMATAPAYVRPTQEGMYQHFRAISLASTRPVFLYNVPSRTACDLSNDTVLRLAHDYSNIVGIKDATGNVTRACDLFKHKPANFAVYSGDDKTFAEFVLNGGNGVVSVASNLFPGKFKSLMTDALAGNEVLVTKTNDTLLGLYKALSLETNPVALKWGLYFMGITRHSMVRLPLLPLSISSQEQMKLELMDLK